MPFFNRVGFALPERKGIADFLQEVTSPKDQEQYWCGVTFEHRPRHLFYVHIYSASAAWMQVASCDES